MSEAIEDPADLASLLATLQKEAEQRRKKAQSVQQVIAGLAGGYVVVALILFIIKREIELSSILSFASLFGCLAAGVSMSSHHRQALSQAAQWQDPRVIPHLIEALDADQQEVKDEAKAVLKSLLPRSAEAVEKGVVLSLKQRQLLTDLCRDKDEELALRAVRSLALLGDESSLKTLDDLGRASREQSKLAKTKISALALEAAGDLRLRLARQMVELRSSSVSQGQKDKQEVSH